MFHASILTGGLGARPYSLASTVNESQNVASNGFMREFEKTNIPIRAIPSE
jgi:hypothetical protein